MIFVITYTIILNTFSAVLHCYYHWFTRMKKNSVIPGMIKDEKLCNKPKENTCSSNKVILLYEVYNIWGNEPIEPKKK